MLLFLQIDWRIYLKKCGYEIILTIQRESCVLTFHSLHESEADWMDLNKIDDYKCGIALFRSQV